MSSKVVNDEGTQSSQYSLTVDDLRQKGNDLFKKGDYSKAKEVYAAALTVANDDTMKCTLLSNKAFCHLKLDECSHCIEDCTAALTINPTHAKCLYRRAVAYDFIRSYSESFRDLKALLHFEPENKDGINLMRKVKVKVQQEAEDTSEVKSVLDKMRKDSSAILSGLKTLIGLCYDDKHHTLDFGRKGGLSWICGLINEQLSVIQNVSAAERADTDVLVNALRFLSAACLHKEFVLQFIDLNAYNEFHDGSEREHSFAVQRLVVTTTTATNNAQKVVMASICSLLGASVPTIHHNVMILMLNIIKTFPAFTRRPDGGESTDNGAAVSLLMSDYCGWNIMLGLKQVLTLHASSQSNSGTATGTAAYLLACDSLGAFCSENQCYIGEAPEIDHRMESIEERKKRFAEEHVLKSRAQKHCQFALDSGTFKMLIEHADQNSTAYIRQASSSCLVKLINTIDNEDLLKQHLSEYLPSAEDVSLEGTENGESRVVELKEDAPQMTIQQCRLRASLEVVLLQAKPDVGLWALKKIGGIAQLLMLVSTGDLRCQEAAAEVMCLAAATEGATELMSPIVASGVLHTLLRSPDSATQAAAASTMTKLSIKAKAINEASPEVAELLNSAVSVLKSVNASRAAATASSSTRSNHTNSASNLVSFSALEDFSASCKAGKQSGSGGSSSSANTAAIVSADNASSSSSVDRSIEVIAAMVGKSFVKEEIVHGSSRVASCISELLKLTPDPRNSSSYGLAHILAALTVTNHELRALALADKELTPDQYDQLQELQRIKTKDEDGNVIEEKKEDSDMDTTDLCKRRIKKIVQCGAVPVIVSMLKVDSGSSSQTKETAARALRQICVEESARGVVVQQGGLKVCCALVRDAESKKAAKLEAAHAVGKILVTTNPIILSEHLRLGSISPLLYICKETDSSYLMQFEALLSLTNLMSVGDSEREKFVAEKGISAVHYLMFSDNLMVRRAASEVFCNMPTHDKLLQLLRQKEKVRLWLAFCEDWNNENDAECALATARACAGTLACAAGDPRTTAAMIGENCAASIVALLESANAELVHRALVMLDTMLSLPPMEEQEDALPRGAASSRSGISDSSDSSMKEEAVAAVLTPREIAEHLIQGGVVPKLAVVVQLNNPQLADMAKSIAVGLSQAMQTPAPPQVQELVDGEE